MSPEDPKLDQTSSPADQKPEDYKNSPIDYRGWKAIWCGGAIFAFIALFGVLAVMILSATQIQSRFAGLRVNGRTLSVAQIGDLAEHWEGSSRKAQRYVIGEVGSAYESVIRKQNTVRDENSKELSLEDEIKRNTRELADILRRSGADLDTNDDPQRVIVKAEQSPELCSTDAAKECKDKLETLKKKQEKLLEANSAWMKARRELEAEDSIFRTKLEQAKLLDLKQIMPLSWSSNGTSLEASVTSPIENAIFEYADNIGKDWSISKHIYYWARSPTETLTLWLVVILGALGASLQLGYSFITGAPFYWSYLAFRPAFGAATALVVFVVFIDPAQVILKLVVSRSSLAGWIM